MRLMLLSILLLSAVASAQNARGSLDHPMPSWANRDSLPGMPRVSQSGKSAKFNTFLKGWSVAGTEGAYELSCDVVASNCAIAILRSTAATADSYGALLHREPAQQWRGTRVRLRAEVRGGRVDAWAGAWLRAEDKDGKLLAARTMRSAPISGTTSFEWVVLEFEVPADAETLLMGVELQGQGAIFVRELQFESASDGAISSR